MKILLIFLVKDGLSEPDEGSGLIWITYSSVDEVVFSLGCFSDAFYE